MPLQSSSSTLPGQGSFEQFKAMLLSHRSLVASLALFNSWVFAMSWSGAFSTPFDIPLASVTVNGFWIVSLGICTAVLAFFFLLPPLSRRMSAAGLLVSTLAMASSAALMGLAMLLPSLASPCYIAGAVASGVGTGLMTAYWGMLIPRYDPSVVLGFITASLLASAAVTLVVSVLPLVLGVLCMTVIPFGAWRTFRQALGSEDLGSPSRPARVAKKAPEPTGEDKARSGKTSPSLLIAFMGLVVVLSLSAGLLRSLVGADVPTDQSALVFSVSALCAALMLLISKVPDEGASFGPFYRAIVFIAIAFIVLAFAIPQTNERATFTLAVHSIGFMYFYGMLWVFCVIYAQRYAEESRVFIGGFLANQVGQIAGFFVGGWLGASFGAAAILSPVSNAMVYLLLFAVVALLARLGTEVKPRPSMTNEATMAKACSLAAEQYGLTPRESEILAYLIKGYDRNYIARTLSVSPETVKTHTQHIYVKLDAHTRLEAFNAVAACLESA